MTQSHEEYMGYGDVTRIFKPQPDSLKVIGGLYVGPKFYDKNVALDLDAPIPEAFERGGYIAKDGIKEKIDRASKPITAFGGDELDDAQESYALTYELNLLEFHNPVAQRLAHGRDNVAVTPATISAGQRIRVDYSSRQLDQVSILLVFVNGDQQARGFGQLARVTQVGERTWVHDDLVGFPLTIKAFPYRGRPMAWNIDDGMKLPAGVGGGQ